METHEQVPVRVRAFVDRGVAPLVEALTTLENVVTLDSCQGTDMSDGVLACVYFDLGASTASNWYVLASVVGWIAARCREAGVEALVRLEWAGSNDRPRGVLVVPPSEVTRAAAAVTRPTPVPV